MVALEPRDRRRVRLGLLPTFDAANYEELLTAAADGGSDLRSCSTAPPRRCTPRLHLQDGDPGRRAAEPHRHGGHDVRLPRRDGHRQRAGDQREETPYGKITLEQAMWYSSNTVFGQVGVQLGSDLLVQMATSFGFNEAIPSRPSPGHVPHARP